MNRPNAFIRNLQSLAGTDAVIEVDRAPMTKHRRWGFVVSATTRFLVLSDIDDSYFLNGFSILRTEDIKRYRIVDERGDMIRYVLSRRYPQGYLQRPICDLGGLEDFSFLERLHEGYPLVTVHREEMDDSVCGIGKIAGLKLKTFLLRTINIDATWDSMARFRYDDVTRIDFGGNYEEALSIYAEFLDEKAPCTNYIIP